KTSIALVNSGDPQLGTPLNDHGRAGFSRSVQKIARQTKARFEKKQSAPQPTAEAALREIRKTDKK
ncbi:MAG: hypothetical protein ACI9MB_003629, partial [Verrucomicrobiales bacterium]